MVIGIDIRTLIDQNYSGVSWYTLNLIKAMLRYDQSNQYRLFYNCLKDISDRPELEYLANHRNVQIIRTKVPNKIFNYILQKIFHYPKIDSLLGGVDVFWAPHLNFTYLSKNTRSIATIHDLSFWRYPEFFSRRKNFWHRLLGVGGKNGFIQRFDKLIAVSENTKRDIVDLAGIPEERIKVIYSGVSKIYRYFDRSQGGDDLKELEEVRIKYNLPKKFILYVGNLEPRKNINGLIEAFSLAAGGELSEFKLVIAGGVTWHAEEIYQAAEKSPVKSQLMFLGYVDEEDKPALYNLASVLAYPSFYEGFGFPPLEAMACGTPVVASSVSSLPEIVGEAGILVDPYNLSAIAEALILAVKDEKLRETLKDKGLERAKIFNWRQTAKEYLDVFLSND